jgi:hypothetical protein
MSRVWCAIGSLAGRIGSTCGVSRLIRHGTTGRYFRASAEAAWATSWSAVAPTNDGHANRFQTHAAPGELVDYSGAAAGRGLRRLSSYMAASARLSKWCGSSGSAASATPIAALMVSWTSGLIAIGSSRN